jgi:hypothetical protein
MYRPLKFTGTGFCRNVWILFLTITEWIVTFVSDVSRSWTQDVFFKHCLFIVPSCLH